MHVTLNPRLDGPAIARDLEDQGFSIIEGVLDPAQAAALKARLIQIAGELEARGVSTHTAIIDPNPANVRVYGLPDHDPAFLQLVSEPVVREVVDACLGPDVILSNFSANIARPGAKAMKIHSDMALVIPAPWRERWALNMIWCLDDIYDANGATRYLPGSHRFSEMAELPADAEAQMRAFEAPAGSVIVLDGRTWHSSGDNITQDADRALLFAYFSRGFIRPQACWHETLRPPTITSLDEAQRQLFGFGELANVHGAGLVTLT
ncbi:phytanoyl-CoA dioxygenase family protein [Novosphingobium sp. JCM 18896]|uniref:phytanoyl-CoA dioxygenase family protein n=1 Tax=Novosphingobium sp. JCM 18896 TaxID=2989731 RepID=UPI00222165E4|nr:phytanoyl-CoA dioxygenase family protein [Novosphingobium sp. JCM 18896]MCW1431700.1 phytanoyl-CoA dioxygenase family protein [Novosphingobium sp. JCM 18896]